MTTYLGKVKVKVGPVTSEFSGKAHFVERDGETHRARGGRQRQGGARDRKCRRHHHRSACTRPGDRSRVTVDTDLKIVGKLAQFGSGMLQQVSEKLLGEFVDSLEAKLAAGDADEDAARTAPTNGQVERPAPEPAPIDLIELAGGGAIKKYGPPVFGAFCWRPLVFTLGRLRWRERRCASSR